MSLVPIHDIQNINKILKANKCLDGKIKASLIDKLISNYNYSNILMIISLLDIDIVFFGEDEFSRETNLFFDKLATINCHLIVL